ncbi:uncharacterized protein KQ657_005069 [Scheffersomyces spartinae]|uniref:Uncharacterized protein n=1 Tax=Scheffersomyces spartinae TaxID=45513 RepID=A0A9P7V9H3_9ASCO|nr:uncharacterized protein KQ657_005069 [Scheffersomyces spartinae]KAG7193871.1 hypothetical protein KQ657_005069 [Scheffersomyces spartinae]
MLQGVELLDAMTKLQSPLQTNTWNNFLQVVLDMRNERLQGQRWRDEYLSNKKEIEAIRNPIKRLSQKKQTNGEERVKMSHYTPNQQHKLIKKQTKRSIVEASWLTGKYLRQLQQQGLIPIPSKLDYTKEAYLGSLLPFESRTDSTPKSITYKTIKEAYDLDYIDGVIKPGLEYDINYHFYLKHLRLIVNEKGPYEVKIKEVSSAPIPFPYLKLPFPDSTKSRQISMDVARLIKHLRILKVWKSAVGDEKVPENKYPDGSYGVKGSKGFYLTERMFPYSYYKKWAKWEGEWESMIEEYEANSKTTAEPTATKSNSESRVKEWLEFINIATNELESEWQQLRMTHVNPDQLKQEQAAYQQQMMYHYDDMVEKYNSIVDQIHRQQIWKHSELVNRKNRVQRSLLSYLERDDNVPPSKRQGLPENGRIQLGKTLADILADNEYHSFKMGQKFKRELNFKEMDKFIRI